ncbi:MAG: hypothetical protein FWG50_06745 [Kiritimatiellaeota bacterium]|nr:hypothetical protein [Kiritimatiellota bacterium]
MNPSFRETVNVICQKDSRYQPEAYSFLVEALDATVKSVLKDNPEHSKHVTGKELLEGIRAHALTEFGPLAHMVFAEWGVRATIDFGAIVFNLIDAGRLGKTDTDSIEDFREVFSFEEAFRMPFELRLETGGE